MTTINETPKPAAIHISFAEPEEKTESDLVKMVDVCDEYMANEILNPAF